VLFVCTGNSVRSPMAEALLRDRTGGRVDVASAGTRAGAGLHPGAVRVLRADFGIDISGRRPQHLKAVSGRRFDYVISLCDRAREVLPDFPGDPRRSHWSVPDPAAAGDDRTGYTVLQHIAANIDTRIRHLTTALAATDSEGDPP
jgi:protein-tyrosine-phosphatase